MSAIAGEHREAAPTGLLTRARLKWLAYATLADLGIAVVLGLTMAARWIRVYRTYRGVPSRDPSATRVLTVPPERHFPLPAVVLHGVLAVTTVVLVVVTVLTD